MGGIQASERDDAIMDGHLSVQIDHDGAKVVTNRGICCRTEFLLNNRHQKL